MSEGTTPEILPVEDEPKIINEELDVCAVEKSEQKQQQDEEEEGQLPEKCDEEKIESVSVDLTTDVNGDDGENKGGDILKNGHEPGKDIEEQPTEKDTLRGSGLRGFFRRLFQKPKDEDDKIQDPEAAAELLSKKPLEISSKDSEKGIEVKDYSDETVATAEVGETSYKIALSKWIPNRLILIVAACLLLLLAIVIPVAIMASGSGVTDEVIEDAYYQTVRTSCGPVEGLLEDGALVFRGIPYALPPIGMKRWKPSELPSTRSDCWNGTYKAHEPAKLCYQKPLPHPYGYLDFSEDCLYLDVYTPRVTREFPLPVVVYLAGDSFMGHDVLDFGWRPSGKLVKEKEVVFIVVYYRMNAFGFLALELLTNEMQPPASGNYGLHDIVTALKWINVNIEDFGGSSTKITVLGHGSGATGILALISSDAVRSLFAQAWITGGSAHFVNKTLREVERNNEAFNRHLMCDRVECLYNKTAEDILAAIPTSEWPRWGVPNYLELPTHEEHTAAVVVTDGKILYDNPKMIWDENKFVDVTLMVGSSIHSVGSQLQDSDLEDTWEWFNKTVRKRLGSFGFKVSNEAIERYYRDNGSAVEQYTQLLSDLRVTCPLLDLSYRASKAFFNHVYFYVVSYVPDGVVNHMELSHRLAVHGLDVAAIFGRIPEMLANPSERDLQFQTSVQDAFFQFVRHGRLESNAQSCTSVECLAMMRTPKMPWDINWAGEQFLSSSERYPNCDFWTNAGMYPSFARMN